MDVCLFNTSEFLSAISTLPWHWHCKVTLQSVGQDKQFTEHFLHTKSLKAFPQGLPILPYWWMTFFTPWHGRYCSRAATCAWSLFTSFSLTVLAVCVRAVLSVKIIMSFLLFSLAASFCTSITDMIDTCLSPAFYVDAKLVKSSMSQL